VSEESETQKKGRRVPKTRSEDTRRAKEIKERTFARAEEIHALVPNGKKRGTWVKEMKIRLTSINKEKGPCPTR